MKTSTLSGAIIVSLIVCNKKFLIFNNKSEKEKNTKGRERKNFKLGKQLST
jgi:hypothetical protein